MDLVGDFLAAPGNHGMVGHARKARRRNLFFVSLVSLWLDNFCLCEVDGVALEIRETAEFERALMRRAQHHARRVAVFESLLPARRAQAPAVALLQSGKAEFGQRC